MKIVFIGDSLTQGTYGANYVNKVAAALRGHHFINEGVNGDTSLNLYRRVNAHVIDHQPQGVFIMIGVNDAISYSEPGTRLYFRFIKRIRGGRMTPITFRENLRATLTRLQFAQIRTWVALPPVEYRPAVVDALRQVNAAAAEVCEELRIPALDLMAILTPEEIPNRPPMSTFSDLPRKLLGRLPLHSKANEGANAGFTYTFDGIHLTEDGAQRMADAIVSFLRANGVSG
jgi:lysophospholipase L1-like esterase